MANEFYDVVIVGAGGAGLTAAEHVRKHSSARVMLINKEPSAPYNRLSLTRFLARPVPEADLLLKPADWYTTQGVDLLRGEVQQIDRRAHRVELADGQTLDYDRLVLANGAHPFVPPVVGVSREGVTPLRTLAHAKAVLAAARKVVPRASRDIRA